MALPTTFLTADWNVLTLTGVQAGALVTAFANSVSGKPALAIDSGADAPSYVAASNNQLPALQFAGASALSAGDNYDLEDKSLIVFVVAKRTGTASAGGTLVAKSYYGSLSARYSMGSSGGIGVNGVVQINNNTWAASSAEFDATDTEFHLYELRILRENGALFLLKDKQLVGSVGIATGSSNATNSESFRVGRYAANFHDFFTGLIQRVVIYQPPNDLSAADSDEIYNTLGAAHKLPYYVPPPPPDPSPPPPPTPTVVLPPRAQFTIEPSAGHAPLTIQFTNTSQNATAYRWYFNNDRFVDNDAQNPSFTFEKPGIYAVRLEARNADNAVSAAVKTIAVTSSASNQASFSNLDYFYSHLPARYRREDRGLFLRRFMSFFTDTLDDWDERFVEFHNSISPRTASDEFINWWLQVLFDWSWFPECFTLADKRRLYSNMGRHYARRGTARGIEEWLRDFGITAKVNLRGDFWDDWFYDESHARSEEPLVIAVEIISLRGWNNADLGAYSDSFWDENHFVAEPRPRISIAEIETLLRFQQPLAQDVHIIWKTWS